MQGAIFVTISSFALLVLYPAVCQMVLKRRKVVSAPSTDVKLKTMNNVKGPGVPLVQADKLNNPPGSEMSKEYFMKNNNVTLNNGSTNNTKLNLDKYNDDSVKFVDLEAGNQRQQDSCETCLPKSWVDWYLALLKWRWFTVSYLCIVSACF